MAKGKPVLIIPVENQVRELDAKLLLACVAAERGIASLIGPKREIEFRIASFPRGVFLAKSLRIGNRKVFPVSRRLGHAIVAWDEEALVHLPPEIYFSRRLPETGLEHVSHLFAWGEDNADLWRQYPRLPDGIRIHVTGNPRNDLLRPDVRSYYAEEAENIRRSFGDFILVNTNFNHVNAFHAGQNLFQPSVDPGRPPEFGQAAMGMPRPYAEGLRDHKQALFIAFQQMIPCLERAFPDYAVVVRPHPTENPDVYHRVAGGCRRVHVTNDGNVVPWLMACRALVHNGCTTGVEAYVMRVPALSFRPVVNELYDDGFYRLPNRLSLACFSFDELQDALRGVLSEGLAVTDGPESQAVAARHLAAMHGPLACRRIVDVLGGVFDELGRTKPPGAKNRISGWLQTTKRRLRQTVKSHLPGSLKSADFLRHRYPPIRIEDVRLRLLRFQRVTGGPGRLGVEALAGGVFRISA